MRSFRWRSAVGPGLRAGAAQVVVTGSAGVGDNTASWDPTISVDLPAGAVNGSCSGTLTHSVA
ncbi:hypothetical protein ACGF0D_12705 [Kitasatospora sp. NPDC048298]|uniref:hypothetical protein n=1 Tax=Kitasatospora sp. NPDC048298 TaxID=3364049 RepID=UPI003711B251